MASIQYFLRAKITNDVLSWAINFLTHVVLQVNVLAEMESSGIGVDMDACCHTRQVIEKRIKALEARAHQLAGTPFALSAPAEVAHTLYKQLKLPVPPGCNKGKQHPTTNKHALDLLRYWHSVEPLESLKLRSFCSAIYPF